MLETNIVVLHDQTPQRISLPDPPFLNFYFYRRQSRRRAVYHSRRHERHDVCIATKPTSLLLLFSLFFVFQQRRKNAVLEEKDKTFLKRSKKKSLSDGILILARREYDTKARSHALTHAMRKKMDVFAAGTRTLVDRGHYFHLKAGHDNHLHHSEPIRKWYKASFLTCDTIFTWY